MYPILDTEKCTGCGLCTEVCGLDIIVRNGNGQPTIDRAAYCHACGHCIAICPRNALSMPGAPGDEFAPLRAPAISPLDMETFLLTKRSCREFQDRPVDKSVIEKLIDVARMAPTSINCQERTFIVVTDAAKVAELREALRGHARSVLRLVKLAASKPAALFLSPADQQHMRHLRADFEVALHHLDNGDDYIFHNAPCLIFFTGITMDPSGRDHALGAQHYLMLYAETLGLGSCINGYAQSAPKVLAKHLNVPQAYTIYGAIMLGYRKHTYRKRVYRKAASVAYYE
ncbi:MAG: nitroreductase family protein [Thermoflexales bacterium]|nr:nitroreductase family protein [Thermoflexales bacterium]